jgi:hypothetical protein
MFPATRVVQIARAHFPNRKENAIPNQLLCAVLFPGIDFNPSFYNLGSSAVSLEYLQSNYLRSTSYAISRALYTIFLNILFHS